MTELQRLAWKGPPAKLQRYLDTHGEQGLDPEDLSEALRYAVMVPSPKKVQILLDSGADPLRAGSEDDQLLAHAAIGGDPTLLEKMLELGCDPNHANINGRTPLIWAASFGRTAAVRVLLEQGAEVNAVPKTGYCPLLESLVDNRGPDTALALIEAGADVRARTPHDGRTALHYAAAHGLPEVMEALVRNGADIESRGGPQGERPLHAACRSGNVGAVRYLLGAGATPLARDDRGNTALSVARPWELDTIRLMADTAPELIHAVCDNRTLLDSAATAGATEVVAFLLSRGAAVQAREELGRSALVAATHCARHETVSRLLADPGTHIDYRSGPLGFTALMTAARARDGEELALGLLDAGSDAHIRDENGDTALHHAVEGAAVKLAARLLDAGSPVDDPGRGGVTPLMRAAGNRDSLRPAEHRSAVVDLLLDGGADVRSRDASGRTPLHFAPAALGTEVVQRLLDAGADIDARDDSGETLLSLSAQFGAYDDRYRRPRSRKQDPMADLIFFLLERGADPNLAGPWAPPLGHASHLRCREVVKELKRHGAVTVVRGGQTFP